MSDLTYIMLNKYTFMYIIANIYRLISRVINYLCRQAFSTNYA